jgi:hypothetical protein
MSSSRLTYGLMTPSLKETGILIGPMDKDPSDLGVDIRIIKLYGEGTVGAAWPRICPHCHLLLLEWLDVVADESP